MKKMVVLALSVDLTDEEIIPVRQLSYAAGDKTTYVPMVVMSCESKEQLVDRVTNLAEQAWDLAQKDAPNDS